MWLLHKALEAAQLEKRTCTEFLAADGEQERLELLRHRERQAVDTRCRLEEMRTEVDGLRRSLVEREAHVAELQGNIKLMMDKNQAKQQVRKGGGLLIRYVTICYDTICYDTICYHIICYHIICYDKIYFMDGGLLFMMMTKTITATIIRMMMAMMTTARIRMKVITVEICDTAFQVIMKLSEKLASNMTDPRPAETSTNQLQTATLQQQDLENLRVRNKHSSCSVGCVCQQLKDKNVIIYQTFLSTATGRAGGLSAVKCLTTEVYRKNHVGSGF